MTLIVVLRVGIMKVSMRAAGILCMLMLVYVLGACASSREQEVLENRNVETFTSFSQNIRFTYPKDWFIFETEEVVKVSNLLELLTFPADMIDTLQPSSTENFIASLYFSPRNDIGELFERLSSLLQEADISHSIADLFPWAADWQDFVSSSLNSVDTVRFEQSKQLQLEGPSLLQMAFRALEPSYTPRIDALQFLFFDIFNFELTIDTKYLLLADQQLLALKKSGESGILMIRSVRDAFTVIVELQYYGPMQTDLALERSLAILLSLEYF